MKKKERREIKDLINLLIRCDQCLTYIAESGAWPQGYSELFSDLEKFGITDMWYGKTHNKSLNSQIIKQQLEYLKNLSNKQEIKNEEDN